VVVVARLVGLLHFARLEVIFAVRQALMADSFDATSHDNWDRRGEDLEWDRLSIQRRWN